MARRKTPEPVPLKLNYRLAPNQQTAFIDLARDVSRLARKFIRQGKLFPLANIRLSMPPAASEVVGNAVYISTIQQSWTCSNAWHKSFAMWQKQQLETMEEAGLESSIARYRDFKIYMDPEHKTTGNLDPVNLGPFDQVGPWANPVVTSPSPAPSEEWQYSKIVIPNDIDNAGNTSEYFLHMHGADTSASKSLVVGYAQSRAYPHNPDPVAPVASIGWMSTMWDVGEDTSEITDLAQYSNDELPYDQDNYPGGGSNYVYPANKAWCANRSTVGVNQFNLGSMIVPCGLLRIDQLFSAGGVADQPLIIEIELMPGDDRGYLLGDMQDM